ncbi:MAG: SMC-Scp complex subunit ScpB [Rhodospirillales bacterium]
MTDLETNDNAVIDEPEAVDAGAVDADQLRLLEALLFAAPEPLSERQLANRLPEGADVKALLKRLRGDYEGRGVQLECAGKSWAFRTAPDLAAALAREVEVSRKLGRAVVETLAIVAYHQPVTRGEIEEIRGVSLSKGTLDQLLAQGWIKPRGRRETPGRPMQWGTTDAFLDHFGLERVRDLPGLDELKKAGLLDARPAIEAYATRGAVGARSEVLASLPSAGAALEEPDDQAEPLDPDG